MKNSRFSVSACGVLFACALSVSAQNSAIQQSEQTQRHREIQSPAMRLDHSQDAPELYAGENQDVGPQRMLRMRPQRAWWQTRVDSEFVWSDNPTLAGSGFEKDSTVFINTIEAALAPSDVKLHGHPIYPRLGVRAQWYNYGVIGTGHDAFGTSMNNFDFHSEYTFAEARYELPKNFQTMAGVDFGRLMSQGNYNEFYREMTPSWGLQWRHQISDVQTLTLAYEGNYHISTTVAPSRDMNNRVDQNFYISYTHEVFPNLVLQPFYRFQLTRYVESGARTDTLHDFGLTVTYYFTKWASVRAFTSYQIHKSAKELILPNYEKLDAGLGAALHLRF